MLTIHHLERSQSERIVWLCEELGLPYDLRRYARDPVTILGPPELKALHPAGTSPVIVDGDVVLAESGAIVEYLLGRHGGGRLRHGPDHPDFAAYLYWFHFANATLQMNMVRNASLRRLGADADHPVVAAARARLDGLVAHLDARLGEADYLAGDAFTAADVMTVFPLTTMRLFMPLDLAPYAGIRAYLGRIGAREAYRRAMRAGDPDLAPLLA